MMNKKSNFFYKMKNKMNLKMMIIWSKRMKKTAKLLINLLNQTGAIKQNKKSMMIHQTLHSILKKIKHKIQQHCIHQIHQVFIKGSLMLQRKSYSKNNNKKLYYNNFIFSCYKNIRKTINF